jgi:hypothetical protein
VFGYDALDMADRFFYSGGSVRDFAALAVDDIEIAITHAVREVNDPEKLWDGRRLRRSFNLVERCRGEELLDTERPAVSQHRQHRQIGTKEHGVQI